MRVLDHARRRRVVDASPPIGHNIRRAIDEIALLTV